MPTVKKAYATMCASKPALQVLNASRRAPKTSASRALSSAFWLATQYSFHLHVLARALLIAELTCGRRYASAASRRVKVTIWNAVTTPTTIFEVLGSFATVSIYDLYTVINAMKLCHAEGLPTPCHRTS